MGLKEARTGPGLPQRLGVKGMCASSGRFCLWAHGLLGAGGLWRRRRTWGLSPGAVGCRSSGGTEEPAPGPGGRRVRIVTRVPVEPRSEGRLGRREDGRVREGPLSVCVAQASPPG